MELDSGFGQFAFQTSKSHGYVSAFAPMLQSGQNQNFGSGTVKGQFGNGQGSSQGFGSKFNGKNGQTGGNGRFNDGGNKFNGNGGQFGQQNGGKSQFGKQNQFGNGKQNEKGFGGKNGDGFNQFNTQGFSGSAQGMQTQTKSQFPIKAVQSQSKSQFAPKQFAGSVQSSQIQNKSQFAPKQFAGSVQSSQIQNKSQFAPKQFAGSSLTQLAQTKPQFGAASKMNNISTTAPKFEKKCRNFQNIGFCERGDNCSFVHDVPQRSQPKPNNSFNNNAGSKYGNTVNQTFSDPEICRYFILGTCSKGDSCTYSHNTSGKAAVDSLIRAPAARAPKVNPSGHSSFGIFKPPNTKDSFISNQVKEVDMEEIEMVDADDFPNDRTFPEEIRDSTRFEKNIDRRPTFNFKSNTEGLAPLKQMKKQSNLDSSDAVIRVTGHPFNSANQLKAHFAKFGNIIRFKNSGKVVFVTFSSAEEAKKATMRGTVFNKLKLVISSLDKKQTNVSRNPIPQPPPKVPTIVDSNKTTAKKLFPPTKFKPNISAKFQKPVVSNDDSLDILNEYAADEDNAQEYFEAENESDEMLDDEDTQNILEEEEDDVAEEDYPEGEDGEEDGEEMNEEDGEEMNEEDDEENNEEDDEEVEDLQKERITINEKLKGQFDHNSAAVLKLRNDALAKLALKPTSSSIRHPPTLSRFPKNITNNQTAVKISDKVSKPILVSAPTLTHSELEDKNDLNSAADFTGECMDMCPAFERQDREINRELSEFEIVPGTEQNVTPDYPRTDVTLAVAKYKRSAADAPMPTPDLIRPPEVLLQSMNHLLDNVLDRDMDEETPFINIYKFIRDRFRGIRKDFTYQRTLSLGDTSILIHEQQLRFYLLAGHELCNFDAAEFDPKQNDEQMSKCLTSLLQFYEDNRLKGKTFQSEAEFRGYQILINIRSEEAFVNLSPELLKTDSIRFALQVYSAFHENNYVRFFNLVKKGTILQACALHRWFHTVRMNALKTMSMAYKGRNNLFPLSSLQSLFCFDDDEQTCDFLYHFGILATGGLSAEDENVPYIDFNSQSIVNPSKSLPLWPSSIIWSLQELSSRAEILRTCANTASSGFLKVSPHRSDSIESNNFEISSTNSNMLSEKRVNSVDISSLKSSFVSTASTAPVTPSFFSPSTHTQRTSIFNPPSFNVVQKISSATIGGNVAQRSSVTPSIVPPSFPAFQPSYTVKSANASPVNNSRHNSRLSLVSVRESPSKVNGSSTFVQTLPSEVPFTAFQNQFLPQNVPINEVDSSIAREVSNVPISEATESLVEDAYTNESVEESEEHYSGTEEHYSETEGQYSEMSNHEVLNQVTKNVIQGFASHAVSIASASTRLAMLGKMSINHLKVRTLNKNPFNASLIRCPNALSYPLDLSSLLSNLVDKNLDDDLYFTGIISIPASTISSELLFHLDNNSESNVLKYFVDNGSPLADLNATALWLLLKFFRGSVPSNTFHSKCLKPISSYSQEISANMVSKSLHVDLQLFIPDASPSLKFPLRGVQSCFFLLSSTLTVANVHSLLNSVSNDNSAILSDLLLKSDVLRLLQMFSHLHSASTSVVMIYYHIDSSAIALLSSLAADEALKVISCICTFLETEVLKALVDNSATLNGLKIISSPLHVCSNAIAPQFIDSGSHFADLCLRSSISRMCNLIKPQPILHKLYLSDILKKFHLRPIGKLNEQLIEWVLNFNFCVTSIAENLSKNSWPNISWPPTLSCASALEPLKSWNDATILSHHSYLLSSLLLPVDHNIDYSVENPEVFIKYLDQIQPVSLHWPPTDKSISVHLVSFKSSLLRVFQTCGDLSILNWDSIMNQLLSNRISELYDAEFELFDQQWAIYSNVPIDDFVNSEPHALHDASEKSFLQAISSPLIKRNISSEDIQDYDCPPNKKSRAQSCTLNFWSTPNSDFDLESEIIKEKERMKSIDMTLSNLEQKILHLP